MLLTEITSFPEVFPESAPRTLHQTRSPVIRPWLTRMEIALNITYEIIRKIKDVLDSSFYHYFPFCFLFVIYMLFIYFVITVGRLITKYLYRVVMMIILS